MDTSRCGVLPAAIALAGSAPLPRPELWVGQHSLYFQSLLCCGLLRLLGKLGSPAPRSQELSSALRGGGSCSPHFTLP